MIYVYAILLCLINAVWLATVVFYFPGNWMIVISTAALAFWQRDSQMISFWTVGVMAFLALIGEFIEFLAGLGGAKQAGAGWLASIAAIGGAIVGAFSGRFYCPSLSLAHSWALYRAGLANGALSGSPAKNSDCRCGSGVGAGLGVFIGTSSKSPSASCCT